MDCVWVDGVGVGLAESGGSLREKKTLRNANINERSQARSLLPGHGTFSISKVGLWRLAAVGGGWRRLVVGDWGLAVAGGWQRLAVGGGWWLAVCGPWWRSLSAVLRKNNSGF